MIDVQPKVWRCLDWNQLDQNILYDIMRLRSQVFVVEQNCVYLDLDDRDRNAYHLIGIHNSEIVVAYARLFLPGKLNNNASIGRVIVHPDYRSCGYGHELIIESINRLKKLGNEGPIIISAQCYLIEFYKYHGFVCVGDQYDEDGIAHIKMIRGKE